MMKREFITVGLWNFDLFLKVKTVGSTFGKTPIRVHVFHVELIGQRSLPTPRINVCDITIF